MDPVSPHEPLSRFIDEHKKFSPGGGIPKWNAFTPNRNGKTSVFRIEALADEEIWETGALHVEPQRKKPILARAEFKAEIPIGLGLEVNPHEPPPRHANIERWPADESLRKMNSQALAHASKLVLRRQDQPKGT